MPAKRLLIKRSLVVALTSLVILAGLLVGGVRLLDQLVPGYRQALAARIGNRIGARIGIDSIELRWRWQGPVLALSDVSVWRRGEDRPAVTMDELDLHFSFSDLIHGRRLPDGLSVDVPRLALRLGDDGRPKLVHWSRPDDPPLGWDAVARLRELLRTADIDDARVQLRSPRLPGGKATLDAVDLQWQDNNGRLTWQAGADGDDLFAHIAGSGQVAGALAKPRSGNVDITLDGLDTLALAQAGGRLGASLAKRLSGGRVSTHVTGAFAQNRLVGGQADIAVSAIEGREHDRALLPALTATLEAAGPEQAAQPAAGKQADVRFELSKLKSDTPELANFALTGAIDAGARAITLEARHPPSAIALRVARLFYPRLADTDLEAAVDNLTLTVRAGAPPDLGFDFAGLTVTDPRITLGPLAGRYEQHHGDHRLQFERAGGELAIDRYLRGKLALDGLQGTLAWRNTNNGWDIDARDITLESGKASASVTGRVHLPVDGAPVVDLKARAKAPDAPRLLAHIPQAADLPNERLRDWLAKAITAGHLEKATLELAGPLDRFPFAKPKSGERFRLTLQGHGANVAYKSGWPPLKNARGRLVLDGVDLDVDVASAEMLDATLGASSGHVADVREPVLHIDGTAKRQPAEKMLAFLSQSPLRDKFDTFLKAVTITGPADLNLALRIPLKPGLGDLTFNGRVTGHGNTLRQKVLPGPITNITGQVSFDRDGLTGRGLHGKLLGVAITSDIEALADKSQRIVSQAKLTLPRDADLVSHYLPRPWLTYARGQTNARLAFSITRSGHVSDVVLNTDLAGLGLKLPAPLAKAPASKAPLAVTVRGDAKRVHVDYDNKHVDVAVRLANGHPTRIQAVFNNADVQPPDTDGIWIGGRTPALDGVGWFHVVRDQLAAAAKAARKSGKAGPTLDFLGGDVRVGQLDLGQRHVKDAHIRAQPMNARPGWRIDFEGPNSQGQVTWTKPAGGNVSLAGRLARLALKTRPPSSAPTKREHSPVVWADVAPEELPRLDIKIAKLQVDDSDFGQASVLAHVLFNGWQLDRLLLKGGDLSGWAAGRWLREDGVTSAHARTHLEGHGLAGLLRTAGYVATVRAHHAQIDARLAIGANPNGLDLRVLDGHVGLKLGDGTLVSVEPGAARVVGLFNLYVLPRRLRLDFRDVTDKGLAFDTVRANFDIHNGDAHTDDLRIETPSSTIGMKGRIGLAARDYDERVTITPKVGSGAAVAGGVIGGVLGGPLVGAAVFAVQQLLNKPIEKFSTIAYTLKGSWDNPKIAEPSSSKNNQSVDMSRIPRRTNQDNAHDRNRCPPYCRNPDELRR